MSGLQIVRRLRIGACICVAASASFWAGGGAAAHADTLAEPPVFASQDGVLDIMMVATPQPIPTITFSPPDGSGPVHPTGWVYQVCRVRRPG
jgi:hypothetical protein